MALILRLLLLIMLALPAAVRAAPSEFDRRAAELVEVLDQKRAVDEFFTPSFLAVIPASQIEGIARELRRAGGAITGIERITTQDARSGVVEIGYERAIVSVQLALENGAPYRAIGLLIISTKVRGDTVAKLTADFAALPGSAGLFVARLGTNGPEPVIAYRADEQRAIASSYKLWILAEAARQVRSGARRWADVVPLGPPSLASGITQNWPAGAPMTLHSLAVLMISLSDNSASDTVMAALGRDKIDAVVSLAGHSPSNQALPVLTSVEAFALKMSRNADLRDRWIKAGVAERKAILSANRQRLTRSAIDPRQFAGGPLFVDQIEWFASPRDMAKLLDWLRLSGGGEALAILAVNPGTSPGNVERFAYTGYKGGSEAGVIAANYLVRTKSGDWYAVAGVWNNADTLVDQGQFEALMSRALAMIER